MPSSIPLKYVLAIDMGSGSTKAAIGFNSSCTALVSHSRSKNVQRIILHSSRRDRGVVPRYPGRLNKSAI